MYVQKKQKRENNNSNNRAPPCTYISNETQQHSVNVSLAHSLSLSPPFSQCPFTYVYAIVSLCFMNPIESSVKTFTNENGMLEDLCSIYRRQAEWSVRSLLRIVCTFSANWHTYSKYLQQFPKVHAILSRRDVIDWCGIFCYMRVPSNEKRDCVTKATTYFFGWWHCPRFSSCFSWSPILKSFLARFVTTKLRW